MPIRPLTRVFWDLPLFALLRPWSHGVPGISGEGIPYRQCVSAIKAARPPREGPHGGGRVGLPN